MMERRGCEQEEEEERPDWYVGPKQLSMDAQKRSLFFSAGFKHCWQKLSSCIQTGTVLVSVPPGPPGGFSGAPSGGVVCVLILSSRRVPARTCSQRGTASDARRSRARWLAPLSRLPVNRNLAASGLRINRRRPLASSAGRVPRERFHSPPISAPRSVNKSHALCSPSELEHFVYDSKIVVAAASLSARSRVNGCEHGQAGETSSTNFTRREFK
ncbi:hypothetical protein FQA47_015243 [Oryzias melastigma]|uniref:Uncharacterized protein n=1 Tax=Oryzias melastigma TaxID=30732 RepID=A0A834FDF4_ORYME|nr:hypothetical protein FQA47_015243 [Oryzias melastigma]